MSIKSAFGFCSNPHSVSFPSLASVGGGRTINPTEFLENIAHAYKDIYYNYLKYYKEKTEVFKTLLKMYNGDYKKTVIAIEIELQRDANNAFNSLINN